jgi:AraC family transcriptional activator of pobA
MSLLLALVIQMLRLSEHTHDLHAHRHDRRSQQMIAFRERVNRHFREHLSLHDYANFLGITVVTLGRLCHEQLGMTPMTLINARLILEAKRELAHSPQSVKQIAHGMGFSDVGYFSRFFRKHAQCSPSEFRLQAQASRH